MPNKKNQICQVVASINENVGGPAHSVTNLATKLLENSINSHLFTLDYYWHGSQVINGDFQLHSPKATYIAKYFRGWQPTAGKKLQQLAQTKLDLIHNHGLWMFPNVYARQAAVKNKLPLVISPRGMLESWSLKYSWYKKKLAWLLYEKQNLDNATLFHATSRAEMESIRNLGYQQPIALIPNGVNLPDLSNKIAPERLIKLFPNLADKKWLLFLSRIHPKKGLDNLLYIWQNIVSKFPDWHLIIAGSDSIGYQAQLKSLVSQLQLEPLVTFTGMLTGEIKESALSHADLFILPSHSENFGIAIAESLSYGVPVITTKETPWQDLLTYDCGWWVEDNQLALKTALIEAMKLSDSQRQAMGNKGRTMVQDKYSWDYVGKQMAEVYSWILSGGTTPTCVHLH